MWALYLLLAISSVCNGFIVPSKHRFHSAHVLTSPRTPITSPRTSMRLYEVGPNGDAEDDETEEQPDEITPLNLSDLTEEEEELDVVPTPPTPPEPPAEIDSSSTLPDSVQAALDLAAQAIEEADETLSARPDPEPEVEPEQIPTPPPASKNTPVDLLKNLASGNIDATTFTTKLSSINQETLSSKRTSANGDVAAAAVGSFLVSSVAYGAPIDFYLINEQLVSLPSEFSTLVAIPAVLSIGTTALTTAYVNPSDEELLAEGKTGMFGRRITTTKENIRSFFAGIPRGMWYYALLHSLILYCLLTHARFPLLPPPQTVRNRQRH